MIGSFICSVVRDVCFPVSHTVHTAEPVIARCMATGHVLFSFPKYVHQIISRFTFNKTTTTAVVCGEFACKSTYTTMNTVYIWTKSCGVHTTTTIYKYFYIDVVFILDTMSLYRKSRLTVCIYHFCAALFFRIHRVDFGKIQCMCESTRTKCSKHTFKSAYLFSYIYIFHFKAPIEAKRQPHRTFPSTYKVWRFWTFNSSLILAQSQSQSQSAHTHIEHVPMNVFFFFCMCVRSTSTAIVQT